MTEWIEYTGSDEQIKELNSAINSNSNGVLLKLKDGTQTIIRSHLYGYDFVAYLICNPHPLAGMICQQASTGQEVWIKVIVHKLDFHQHNLIEFFRFVDKGMTWERNYSDNSIVFKTTKPVFGIPGAQYSFTEFKD